ncbi:hypothetical protein HEP87_10445 [Streptomyces sp. S1D4-11]
MHLNPYGEDAVNLAADLANRSGHPPAHDRRLLNRMLAAAAAHPRMTNHVADLTSLMPHAPGTMHRLDAAP